MGAISTLTLTMCIGGSIAPSPVTSVDATLDGDVVVEAVVVVEDSFPVRFTGEDKVHLERILRHSELCGDVAATLIVGFHLDGTDGLQRASTCSNRQ